MNTQARSKEHRPFLDRATVVQTALELLKQVGLDGLQPGGSQTSWVSSRLLSTGISTTSRNSWTRWPMPSFGKKA